MKRVSRKPLGWLANLNLITPKFCRLVARKNNGRAAMTNKEIAKVAGISVATVKRLYNLDSWNTVTAEVIHRYSMACGVDLVRPWESSLAYFTSKKLTHIRRAKAPLKTLYRNLLSSPSAH